MDSKKKALGMGLEQLFNGDNIIAINKNIFDKILKTFSIAL